MTDVEKFIKENGVKRGKTKAAKGYGSYIDPAPGIRAPKISYDPGAKHYSRSRVPWLEEENVSGKEDHKEAGPNQKAHIHRKSRQTKAQVVD